MGLRLTFWSQRYPGIPQHLAQEGTGLAKELRDLILCMILSFPSLVNVCGLLTLIVFMFAVLGVNLYTFVAHNDNITEERNFQTLGNGMLLLFQCLTGDGCTSRGLDPSTPGPSPRVALPLSLSAPC